MKPRIMFGLIFGVLGIPLVYYALNSSEGECWVPVLIGVLAGVAGLTTSLIEKAQNSGEAGQLGATTGAIIGVLLGVSMGVGFYSPDGTLGSAASAMFFTIFMAAYLGAITTVVSVVAAILITPKMRLILLAGVIAVIPTYLMISNLAPYGLFNAWHSIKNPPSEAVRILGITGGAKTPEVWIETRDRQIFFASVCSNELTCDPPQWKSISKAPNEYVATRRGTDCKNLGNTSLNPIGQAVECVYCIGDLTSGFGNESYFALMADGSVKYLAMDNLPTSSIIFGESILITPLLYILILTYGFRLTKYIAKKCR